MKAGPNYWSGIRRVCWTLQYCARVVGLRFWNSLRYRPTQCASKVMTNGGIDILVFCCCKSAGLWSINSVTAVVDDVTVMARYRGVQGAWPWASTSRGRHHWATVHEWCYGEDWRMPYLLLSDISFWYKSVSKPFFAVTSVVFLEESPCPRGPILVLVLGLQVLVRVLVLEPQGRLDVHS